MTTTPTLPGPLRLTPSFPFVGRARELATLLALVPRVDGEGRRAALIGGEAGSGKSRLVRELAREAAESGALVLYGACDPAVHTPYRPFVEALDWLVRSSDPETLRDDLGTTGGELARLLPDLPERIDGLVLPVGADPDTERHRLHTAVTELLAAVGRRRPIVLLLEDGHWADAPTLLLLRHLARSAADVRMLLLATFRDTDADVPAELADALADLRRTEDVLRLRLVGLTPEEIAEFVAGAAGGSGSEPALAEAIGALTGGNAFLLCELWRMLVETGAVAVEAGQVRVLRPLDALATPESVREVVAQRLARLAPASRDTLELAAIAGAQFDFDVLARASALSPAEQRHALEQAERSGMIEEVPGSGLAYRFTHELVRRTVATRLTSLRRAELHLRIGEALEEARQPPTDRVVADLAHHFAESAPLGDPSRAVDYNLRAASTAAAALAFDEAVARYRTALDVGIADERRRIAALLDLGTAEYRGGSLRSVESFRTAADMAREIDDDGILLAEAAIGFENACWRPGVVDAGARELLEEASAILSGDDSALRVRLLAGLARSLDFQGAHDHARATRAGAVAMARRLGDRHGLATVLSGAYWGRGAESLGAIVEMLFEAQAIAEEIGDLEIEAEARQWRIAALIGLGQLATARRELAAVLQRAKRTGQPFILHVADMYGSAIALADGRLAEAEAAAARSYEWSRLLTGRDASGGYGIQMFGLRREQGRLPELAPAVRALAGRGPFGDQAWRPARAALFAELGMEQECRAELEQVRAAGLDALRDTSPWLASLTYLTDAAVAVEDRELAALLYTELLPHAGTNVMIGIGVASYGSADRYLGMLAAVLGDVIVAERHLDDAMALNERMGATTWMAHTAYQYARLLLVGEGRAASRGAAWLREASALASRAGLPALLARIRTLEGPVRADVVLPDGLSAREVEILVLVARGLSNREIGAELVISEHTAASHVRSILRKTRCANRTEAASYAHTNGLAASP